MWVQKCWWAFFVDENNLCLVNSTFSVWVKPWNAARTLNRIEPLSFLVFVIHSIAPYKEIQDRFGFWFLRRGLWILSTRWDLDSRFLELNSVFQSPGIQIPQAQISGFPESEYRANPTLGDVLCTTRVMNEWLILSLFLWSLHWVCAVPVSRYSGKWKKYICRRYYYVKIVSIKNISESFYIHKTC